VRTRPIAELQTIFLWHETRKVDKTGVIQLAGNRYEVETALIGKSVDCGYDPYTLTQIHIRYQNVTYADAVPLVLHHHRHREVSSHDVPPKAAPTGINLARLARDRKAAADTQQRAHIRYAQPSPTGEEPPTKEDQP